MAKRSKSRQACGMRYRHLRYQRRDQKPMSNPVCPYCESTSELVTGKRIYPHRLDLAKKRFYLCEDCDAYVGCHPKSTRPLGRLANAELRQWKMKAHAAFDPLWKRGPMTRSEAYAWLAEELGIPAEECHIGLFDVETCCRVVDAARVTF